MTRDTFTRQTRFTQEILYAKTSLHNSRHFGTKSLSHQKPFTQKTVYTRDLQPETCCTQTVFTAVNSCTKNRLRQRSLHLHPFFFTSNNFKKHYLLHQKHFHTGNSICTKHQIYTRNLLNQKTLALEACAPNILYTNNSYTSNRILHGSSLPQMPLTPSFLHQKPITPETFCIKNDHTEKPFTSETMHSTAKTHSRQKPVTPEPFPTRTFTPKPAPQTFLLQEPFTVYQKPFTLTTLYLHIETNSDSKL